jgi:hypothetical protein
MYLSRVNRSTVLINRYLKAAVISRTSTTSANTDDSHPLNVKPLSEIPPTGIYDIPYIGGIFHFKPFSKYILQLYHEPGRLDELGSWIT